MEKNYKRVILVPFDYELAKKIQSGEIEGRIVTKDGKSVRILCFDLKHLSCLIVAAVTYADGTDELHKTYEIVHYFSRSGYFCNNEQHHLNLFIELPEETPICNNPEYSKCKICSNWHCNDCQYNAPKHGFKAGDRVICHVMHKDVNGVIVGKDNDRFVVRNVFGGTFHAGEEDMTLRESKHEFEPFEIVLVRNTSICNNNSWHASYYSNPIIINDTRYHVTTAGLFYIDGDIIPYKGNEHLLGTTNNPE